MLFLGDLNEAFSFCVRTINEFVCIDRAGWHHVVLNFAEVVSRVFSIAVLLERVGVLYKLLLV